MTASLLFSGPPVTAPSEILDAYETLKDGTLYKKYAQSNPRESARVDAYWYGGPQTTAATATGQALLGWARVHRGA